MGVTIGAHPCTSVTITDVVGLGEFVCNAPPGPGVGVVQLRVSIDVSGSATTLLMYDPPNITRVLGTPCNAALPCQLQVSDRRQHWCCEQYTVWIVTTHDSRVTKVLLSAE
jgi:hypothetical protein